MPPTTSELERRAADVGHPVSVQLSVIIPVRNDASALGRLLRELVAMARPDVEIVVVDGGSTDESARVAAQAGARLLTSPPGRGAQLAAGVGAARGRWLWFLHADSRAVAAALSLLHDLDDTPGWGRFEVRFDPPRRVLRLVAAMMSVRSKLTGICTGDQGIFAHRALLDVAGGMPEQPLMEDIELSRRLRRLARPRCPAVTLTTSSRRWLEHGVWRTVVAMWWFRLRYWLGTDPAALARDYYR